MHMAPPPTRDDKVPSPRQRCACAVVDQRRFQPDVGTSVFFYRMLSYHFATFSNAPPCESLRTAGAWPMRCMHRPASESPSRMSSTCGDPMGTMAPLLGRPIGAHCESRRVLGVSAFQAAHAAASPPAEEQPKSEDAKLEGDKLPQADRLPGGQ